MTSNERRTNNTKKMKQYLDRAKYYGDTNQQQHWEQRIEESKKGNENQH